MNIIITGANRGLGLQKVKHIIKKLPDAQIYLTARSETLFNNALTHLKEHGFDTHNLHFLEADFSVDSSIESLVSNLLSRNIKLDVVVNNAGVFSWNKAHDYANILKVNFLGLFSFTEKLLDKDLIQEGGKIINVATVKANINVIKNLEVLKNIPESSKDDLPKIAEHLIQNYSSYSENDKDNDFQISYKVSKTLVNRYTQLLGKDPRVVKKNIQVYAVHPGWVKTDMGTSQGKLEIEEGIKAFEYLLGLPNKVESQL